MLKISKIILSKISGQLDKLDLLSKIVWKRNKILEKLLMVLGVRLFYQLYLFYFEKVDKRKYFQFL